MTYPSSGHPTSASRTEPPRCQSARGFSFTTGTTVSNNDNVRCVTNLTVLFGRTCHIAVVSNATATEGNTMYEDSRWLAEHGEDDSPFAAMVRYWLATGELCSFDQTAIDEATGCVFSLLDRPCYAADSLLSAFDLALAKESYR